LDFKSDPFFSFTGTLNYDIPQAKIKTKKKGLFQLQKVLKNKPSLLRHSTDCRKSRYNAVSLTP